MNSKKQGWVSAMLREIANDDFKRHAALRAECARVNTSTPQEKRAWVSGMLREIANDQRVSTSGE
jgi:hypothetical protein